MVGMTEAGAAFGGIKAALDIAKGIAALNSEAERNQAIIDIQRALLDAQSGALDDKAAIATLMSKVGQLEQKLQNADDWTAEKNRYVLTKSEFGAFTYDLKPEFTQDEIPHRLCDVCFNGGKKSILHTTNKHSGGEQVMCGICKTQVLLTDFVTNITRSSEPSYY